MTFELLCGSLIVVLVGLAMVLNGYRWFLIILPIVGFFFGFVIGAQAMTAIFGTAFLATVTSWVVGFIVAVVFAVLSYFFYFIGVAIFIGSFGYALGYAFMGLFNANLTILTFLVALALGIVFALGAFFLNIQKYLIIIATSFIGAGAIILGILAAFGMPPAVLGASALKVVLGDSVWWLIVFLALGIVGTVLQIRRNRKWELTVVEHNYFDDGATPAA
jgi:hypothetical protein